MKGFSQTFLGQLGLLGFLVGISVAWSLKLNSEDGIVRDRTAILEGEEHGSFDDDLAASADHHHQYQHDQHGDDGGKVHKHASHHEYYKGGKHGSHKKENHQHGAHEDGHKHTGEDHSGHHLQKGHNQQSKEGHIYDQHGSKKKEDHQKGGNTKSQFGENKWAGNGKKDNEEGKLHHKDKGHKNHGFKNVYHKEEYGDYKSFHDEFNDKDYDKKYKDHHEHQEHHGGKYHKGHQHQDHHKNLESGDEHKKWGKGAHENHEDGWHKEGHHHHKNHHGKKNEQDKWQKGGHEEGHHEYKHEGHKGYEVQQGNGSPQKYDRVHEAKHYPVQYESKHYHHVPHHNGWKHRKDVEEVQYHPVHYEHHPRHGEHKKYYHHGKQAIHDDAGPNQYYDAHGSKNTYIFAKDLGVQTEHATPQRRNLNQQFKIKDQER